MSDVIDLLSRRRDRGQTVLHFTNATEALAFATTQVLELEQLAGSALLFDAKELALPLAQAAAVLAECTRLHAELGTHQETS